MDASWLDRAMSGDSVSLVLTVVACIFALLFVYLIRIHIAYRMAKNRHLASAAILDYPNLQTRDRSRIELLMTQKERLNQMEF